MSTYKEEMLVEAKENVELKIENAKLKQENEKFRGLFVRLERFTDIWLPSKISAKYFSEVRALHAIRNEYLGMVKIVSTGGSVKANQEKQKEFEEIAKPLIKFVSDNYNPHTSVIIDSTSAEILTGNLAVYTEEFLRD